MKAKKLLPILALALAATTLAACGDQSVTFGHYWFKDSLTKEENFFEQAEYTVSSKATSTSYCNYEVTYNGTFTTTFAYNATAETYTFETALDVTATFKLGDTTSEVKDSAESKITIDAKSNALRPISSYKKMTCHTPLSGNYESAEKCYATVDYEYTTEYSSDKQQGSIQSQKCEIISSRGEKIEMPLKDSFDFIENYTFIDNEQLLVAVRAFSASTSSATLGSYGAFAENTQKVKVSFTDSDEASTPFQYTLINADGTKNESTKNILYRTARISLDQSNPGVTQQIKLAKAKSASDNDYRNVILEITTPLSYSMGEIYYKLTQISYQKA